MPRVELIYDTDCPNIQGARAALLQGFVAAGLRPSWTEWDRQSAESPPHVRQYGSPTILVDGRDFAGAEPADRSDACRVYDHGFGVLRGVPPARQVAAALASGGGLGQFARTGRGWWRVSASLPGVGATLLPIGACPACWPAYAGVLGSLGLGFLFESTYRLAVTAALFGLTLAALAYRAKTRRGYGPLIFGIASAGLVLLSTSAPVFDQLAYAGVLGLVAASFWNAWPRKRNQVGSCPRCVRQQPAVETRSAR